MYVPTVTRRARSNRANRTARVLMWIAIGMTVAFIVMPWGLKAADPRGNSKLAHDLHPWMPILVFGWLALAIIVAITAAIAGSIARRHVLDDLPRSMRAILEEAGHEARSRGHAVLSPQHALLVCLRDGSVTAALAERGVDVPRLVDGLDAELAKIAPSPGPKTSATSGEVAIALELASARSTMNAHAAVLLELCAYSPETRDRLVACGVRSDMLVEVPPAQPPRAAGEGDTAVVLHNDEVTPFTFVIETLIYVAAIKRGEATKIAVTIDEDERAVIANVSHERATELVLAIERRAREAGYPLRVTLEPRAAMVEPGSLAQ